MASDWLSKISKYRKNMVKNSLIYTQQRRLFEVVRKHYDDATMEYPVTCLSGQLYFLDVAVPSKKLDFEYDGKEYHRDKKKDDSRDKALKYFGWKVIRVDAVMLNKLIKKGL